MKFSEPLQIKFAPASHSDDGAEIGYFTGYGNTWNKDRHGDIVAPGAFLDSIKSMEAGERNIPLLWQHDRMQPLGAVISATEDKTGLLVSGQVVTGHPVSDRAYSLLKKGSLSLSIGFAPLEFEPLPDGGELLKKVDLREISLVSVPSNSQSTVLSVRSLPEFSRPDWERMWAGGTLPPVGSRLSTVLAAACMKAIGTTDDSMAVCERCTDIPDDALIFTKASLAAHDKKIVDEASRLASEIFAKLYEEHAALEGSAQLKSALECLQQIYQH